MFDLIGDDSLELIRGADWLAKHILAQLEENSSCENPHKRAIQLTQIACQFLQATYEEGEPLVDIMVEAAYLLDTFSRTGGNA